MRQRIMCMGSEHKDPRILYLSTRHLTGGTEAYAVSRQKNVPETALPNAMNNLTISNVTADFRQLKSTRLG